jgi:hypothetical protein
VNGGEVKNKFRKARIEMDDARRKQSGKKNFSQGTAVPCAIENRNKNQNMPCKARPLWFRAEIVAIARKQREAWALHAHLDAVIGLRVIGPRSRIGDGVLITRLLGDAGIESFEVIAA